MQSLKLALQALRESDFQDKWEIAKIIAKLGNEVIPPLIEILENEETDLETRWFVVRILSQFDDPSVILTLVKLLRQTEDEELSMMVSQALANIGDSAIETLNNLLAQKEFRLLAVQSLAQIRKPKIIEPLLKIVDDPLPEIRATAIEALGSFHDAKILPILLKGLQDPASLVRKEAVIALGLRVDQQSPLDLVNQIKPLLYDLNPQVCQQAAIALGRMGNDNAADALYSLLKSSATHPWLQLEVVRALSWTKTSISLDYLQAGLSWSNLEVCLEIVTVLGRQVLPQLKIKATEILINFLHSEQETANQPQIKQTLAMSLGELGETQAITSLLELGGDKERTVRLHALAALKKFPSAN